MNNELLEALNILEQEKNISKDTLLEAIENSLLTACKNHFGKAENIRVIIDPETCEFHCYQDKTVVDINENLQSLAGVADQMLITFRRQLQEIVTELRK